MLTGTVSCAHPSLGPPPSLADRLSPWRIAHRHNYVSVKAGPAQTNLLDALVHCAVAWYTGWMVRPADGWDPEAPGSRYTTRVALGLPVQGEEYMHRAERGEQGLAEAVVRDVLGDTPGIGSDLGSLQAVEGSLGRGASGWLAVAEWTADAIGQGVVGAAAWVSFIRVGRWLQERIEALDREGQRVLVSRGAAILLAANHVLSKTTEEGPLGCEAAEDPVSMSGDVPSEFNYTGIEPWLVSLVNADLTTRYVVAIGAEGMPLSLMQMPMTEVERVYSRLGPPPSGD